MKDVRLCWWCGEPLLTPIDLGVGLHFECDEEMWEQEQKEEPGVAVENDPDYCEVCGVALPPFRYRPLCRRCEVEMLRGTRDAGRSPP